MSYLTEHPEIMMEVLAVLVRRAGGSVAIDIAAEGPRQFNLLSKWSDDGTLSLILDETLSEDEARRLMAGGDMHPQ